MRSWKLPKRSKRHEEKCHDGSVIQFSAKRTACAMIYWRRGRTSENLSQERRDSRWINNFLKSEWSELGLNNTHIFRNCGRLRVHPCAKKSILALLMSLVYSGARRPPGSGPKGPLSHFGQVRKKDAPTIGRWKIPHFCGQVPSPYFEKRCDILNRNMGFWARSGVDGYLLNYLGEICAKTYTQLTK